jgi:glycosyltransferase involved in cell wall biosynthesis
MKVEFFCVVIPVFNEEVGIKIFVQDLFNFLSSEFPYESTIIIVNDNSTDGTLTELYNLKNSLRHSGSLEFCELIIHTSNNSRGYGNAVKEAFKFDYKREHDFYIIMDSDGTNPVEDILQIHNKIQLGFRYIKANRFFSNSNFGKDARSFKRSILSSIAHKVIRSIVKSECLDPSNGFRAIGSEFKTVVQQNSGGFSSIIEEWVKLEEMGIKISNFNSKLGSRDKDQRKSSFDYSLSTIFQYLKPILFMSFRRIRSRFGN